MDADMERVELNLKSWFLVKGETHNIAMYEYDNIYIYIYYIHIIESHMDVV